MVSRFCSAFYPMGQESKLQNFADYFAQLEFAICIYCDNSNNETTVIMMTIRRGMQGSVVTSASLCVQVPKIDSVKPHYGPLAGGTLVTISGQLLGNASKVPSVFLGSYSQQIIQQ